MQNVLEMLTNISSPSEFSDILITSDNEKNRYYDAICINFNDIISTFQHKGYNIIDYKSKQYQECNGQYEGFKYYITLHKAFKTIQLVYHNSIINDDKYGKVENLTVDYEEKTELELSDQDVYDIFLMFMNNHIHSKVITDYLHQKYDCDYISDVNFDKDDHLLDLEFITYDGETIYVHYHNRTSTSPISQCGYVLID